MLLLALLLGVVLLVSAALKAADRTSTAIAAATYGLHGRPARWAWLPLAGLEAGLAAGVLAGAAAAGWAAAGMLGAFALAQAGVVAAGRGGAPCGCFGARGRVSWASAARAALLAGVAAALALQPAGGPAGLRLAAGAGAVALAAAVVLRARAGTPGGALEVDGEGPALGSRLELPGAGELGSRLELPGAGAGPVRLAFFTSTGCRLCRGLAPAARRMGATTFDEGADPAAWDAAAVPGAPFAVALGADGTVLAKGTVNTARQLGSVLAAARERAGVPVAAGPAADGPGSRRRFLATAGGAVAALTAGRTIGSLVRPGEAEAYHFCGHIYTTDGCPHPTGLPRIDAKGFPLRGRDGVPVDDLGRRVDAAGAPLDDDGRPLLDPDGRPVPPGTRTRVCTAAGRRYGITVRMDGAWYRCCGGRVRKLVDCCTTGRRRINGDGALKGYCYEGRRVFCVMYFQTRVPC
jgi:hypothetical protein